MPVTHRRAELVLQVITLATPTIAWWLPTTTRATQHLLRTVHSRLQDEATDFPIQQSHDKSHVDPSGAMRSQLLTLLAALAPLAFADVEFITPAAGASIAAGTMTVTWQDSGVTPPLSELTLTDLQLLVGGNNAGVNTVRLGFHRFATEL